MYFAALPSFLENGEPSVHQGCPLNDERGEQKIETDGAESVTLQERH